MSEFLYTVDGERVSLAEIKRRVREKVPSMRANTIIYRVNSGMRTWAQLCKDTKAGNADNRRNFNKAGRRL